MFLSNHLNSEFESQNCDALLTSEVFLLLEHRRQQNEAKDEIEDMSEVSSVFGPLTSVATIKCRMFYLRRLCTFRFSYLSFRFS